MAASSSSPGAPAISTGNDFPLPLPSSGRVEDSYRVGRLLQRGGWSPAPGGVFLATRTGPTKGERELLINTGDEVAIKRMVQDGRLPAQRWFNVLKEEIRITALTSFGRVPRHSREERITHAPALYDWFTSPPDWREGDPVPNEVIMVVQYAKGGDLMDTLSLDIDGTMNVCLWTPEERYSVARRVLKSLLKELYYLHGNEIVHRDIKIENLLVLDDKSTRSTRTNPHRIVLSEQATYLLADFGQAYQERSVQQLEHAGTKVTGWWAPENARANGAVSSFSAASDVWCAARVARTILDAPSLNPSPRASALRALIDRLSVENPADRLTAAAALDDETLWKEGMSPRDGDESFKFDATGGSAAGATVDERAAACARDFMLAVTLKRESLSRENTHEAFSGGGGVAETAASADAAADSQ
jgi:serine/threonine protein kinase